MREQKEADEIASIAKPASLDLSMRFVNGEPMEEIRLLEPVVAMGSPIPARGIRDDLLISHPIRQKRAFVRSGDEWFMIEIKITDLVAVITEKGLLPKPIEVRGGEWHKGNRRAFKRKVRGWARTPGRTSFH